MARRPIQPFRISPGVGGLTGRAAKLSRASSGANNPAIFEFLKGDGDGGEATFSFVGILDKISTPAAAAYSVRRLTGTSWVIDDGVTDPLIRIERDSDNAQQNFTYDGNGDLDTVAITAFLGGANGEAVKWFDQSGNGHTMTGFGPVFDETISPRGAIVNFGAVKHFVATSLAFLADGQDAVWSILTSIKWVRAGSSLPVFVDFVGSGTGGTQKIDAIILGDFRLHLFKRDDTLTTADAHSNVFTADQVDRMLALTVINHGKTMSAWIDKVLVEDEVARDLGVTTITDLGIGQTGPEPWEGEWTEQFYFALDLNDVDKELIENHQMGSF